MMTAFLIGLLLATSPDLPVARPEMKLDTLFVKIGPTPITNHRSPQCTKAVVLIHGLGLHPFSIDKVTHAKLRKWQMADCPLVRNLSFHADVFAVSYGQTASVDKIAEFPFLVNELIRLQNEGYTELILIGHSAGGLIARHLVEDNPGLGVTRVIQVCTPNTGSVWASLKTARSAQMDFLLSLSRAARLDVLKKREAKRIPKNVEFTCVVASCRLGGDGIVLSKSQWSPELQSQGIPAHLLRAAHWDVMTLPKTIELLVQLVKQPQPRWDSKKVQEMRKVILP